MSTQPGTLSAAEQATGTKDTTYALVSVLYHALQGAETVVHYLQDAEAAGDQELVQFLHEAQAWQRYLATQAQAVLQTAAAPGRGTGVESRGQNLEPDAHALTRPLPD